MSLRTLVAPLAAVAFLAAFVPAMAMANSANCPNSTWNYGWNWNHASSTCNGNLLVYVVVSNANQGTNRTSQDFTVSVNAQSATPSSFPGSISGTNVKVAGAYSVTALPMQGYTASYSQGCQGNLQNNDSAMCIITESQTNYGNYPYSYYPNQYNPSYPYYPGYSAPLTCSPAFQTVTVGQSITFSATGGEFSQFNWSLSAVPNSTKYNIGRSFTTVLNSPGQQTVTVFNGQQSATCSITVVGYPIPGYSYPQGGMSPVTVTPTYIPRFANTGFEPVGAAGVAFAVVLLMAAGFLAYPYVRRTINSIVRA